MLLAQVLGEPLEIHDHCCKVSSTIFQKRTEFNAFEVHFHHLIRFISSLVQLLHHQFGVCQVMPKIGRRKSEMRKNSLSILLMSDINRIITAWQSQKSQVTLHFQKEFWFVRSPSINEWFSNFFVSWRLTKKNLPLYSCAKAVFYNHFFVLIKFLLGLRSGFDKA